MVDYKIKELSNKCPSSWMKDETEDDGIKAVTMGENTSFRKW
jgi:hypothetical protein